jgi:hypothetical protein
MKRRMTQHEEFEVFKLVLDKFLWLGFGIMALGFFKLATDGIAQLWQGFSFVVAGIIILILFMVILTKEFEIVR